MDFPRDLNQFTFEEKNILNDLIVDTSQEELCGQIMFFIDCCPDEDIKTLYLNLLNKIKNISSNEFKEMIKYFPCETNISNEDLEVEEILYS